MDELKSKVIKFVKKQGALEGPKEAEIDESESIRNSTFVRAKPVEDVIEEVEDDEVLKQLPKHYFDASPDFDIQFHLLKDLPLGIQCQDIKIQLRTLYRQHGVVSKKTLGKILEKEATFQGELQRIDDIQKELAVTLAVCRDSRFELDGAKKNFTNKSLGILKNFKRKQVIYQLLINLRTIRTLQRSDERLHELLEKGEFAGAIQLLLESQNVALSLKHFKCVAQLSWKLQDTLETTEGQLDAVLCQMCKNFEYGTYSKLQEAYEMLDKTQSVMDQLLMHFTSELHSSVFKVVHRFAVSGSSKQFQQLCKYVPSKDFVLCLQEMCQEIWRILSSFYKVMQWHQQNEVMIKSDAPGRDIERNMNKQYVKQKLENGQSRIWNDAQNRVSTYILGHDFSDCKFEDLLQILGILHRLTEIGDELCGSKSEEIFRCIRQQTVSYFQNYHNSTLEELRIFLDNEVWTPCPVKANFILTHLQEFKLLRHSIENHRKPKKYLDTSLKDDLHNSSSNLSTEDSSSCQNTNYFTKFSGSVTPFDFALDDTISDDILDVGVDDLSGYYSVSSEDSDSEELKKAFVEDNPDSGQKKRKKRKEDGGNKPMGPIIANTTITVLRHCGKYLQMCRLLKPIALDVILCMCQLFDYYLYNVFQFFTADLAVNSTNMISFKLQATLKRIEDNLIRKNGEESSQDHKKRITAASLSEMVNLKLPKTLHGLSERIVGIESLIFLSNQFEYIQQYVLHLVPEEKRHFIDQFYSQTVACAADLRRPAYMCVSAHVVDMRSTLKEMNHVNFDVKDVTSEHSPYIDKIVRDMQIFSMRLEEFELDIPKETELALWENIIHIVNNILVEGFSMARKCSNGGRALMLLDYTQLVSKVQKLTPIDRLPNKEFVEAYIKAFYMQENALEEWILQHREYTTKQLESLVHCACHNSKKTKQRLLQILESGK